MKLPPETASAIARIQFGRYVQRRCARSGDTTLVGEIEAAHATLRAAALHLEDREGDEQMARADRDAVSDELQGHCSDVRNTLAGRAVNASRARPYQDIFPDGVPYYADSRVGERRSRYNELVSRLEEFLAPDDAARLEAVPKLRASLEEWDLAVELLSDAEAETRKARTKRDNAAHAWNETLNHVYATLLDARGKAAAERFFPRTTRPRKAPAEALATEPRASETISA